MLLFQLVTLAHQLEDQRLNMYNLAEKKGFLDSEVIKVSQNIDKLINDYNKLVSFLPKQ